MPLHLIAAWPGYPGHGINHNVHWPDLSQVNLQWGSPYSEASRWTNSLHHHPPCSNLVTHCRVWWRTSARFRLWSSSTTRPSCSLMATCSTPTAPWRRTLVSPALVWQRSLCPPWPTCTPGCGQALPLLWVTTPPSATEEEPSQEGCGLHWPALTLTMCLLMSATSSVFPITQFILSLTGSIMAATLYRAEQWQERKSFVCGASITQIKSKKVFISSLPQIFGLKQVSDIIWRLVLIFVYFVANIKIVSLSKVWLTKFLNTRLR